ncbi:MAG TPA: methyltransferase domain-containing protein [Dehalococcoidia bacterium]|nr:methyltransferase domain-containing protein [Dehalococcoidia bacterium]
MASQTKSTFSFEPFARHQFYKDVNRKLVDRIGLKPGDHVVDLACGTGAVTRLIIERVGTKAGAHVIGIDLSEQSLREAQAATPTLEGVVVDYRQGDVVGFESVLDRPVDAITIFNAIHMIKDKADVVAAAFRQLKPGGLFAFSSAFYSGAEPPEAEPFYRKWMMKALRALRREGVSPSRDKVEARHRLTIEEYDRLLEDNGFQVENQEVVSVEMPPESFEDISRFGPFVEGTFPGVDVAKASEALIVTVRSTFEELGWKVSPRNWLLVVARKTT